MDQAARLQRLKVPSHLGSLAPMRHQVSQWLEAQTPTRLGLPAHAILLLRRVQAPWSALRPDSQADVLAPSLRSAVRPASGVLAGAGCDAVWFDGEAELLACLARDSLQGQVGHRWWWQTWLGRRASDDDARLAWLSSARVAPAAMGHLGAWGHAEAWGHALEASGRLALFQAMLAHHPLAPSAIAMLAEALSSDSPRGSASSSRSFIGVDPHEPGHPSAPANELKERRTDADWLVVLDCGGAPVLVALCQVLREAPHDALQANNLPARLGQAMPVDSGPAHATGLIGNTDAARTAPDNTAAQTPTSSDLSPWRPVQLQAHPGADATAPRLTFHHAAEDGCISATGPVHEAVIADSVQAPIQAPSAPVAPHTSSSHAAARPQPMARSGSGGFLETAHGGAFFLLNVALAWELYGDFTRPQHALLSVSPWQFLHAAGLALLGRGFARDPLAPWLREQVRFERPRPASELGAPVLDLIPQSEARSLVAPTGRRSVSELSCWWPLLQQRLSLALDLPASQAPLTCLSLPARVARRGDRVNVHYRLHHLPLSVRLAGLDRNPGWVPSSGCDFRFHFEA